MKLQKERIENEQNIRCRKSGKIKEIKYKQREQDDRNIFLKKR